MKLKITPRQDSIAAEVRGLDIRAGIDAATAQEIEDAFAKYIVLVFPEQPLDDDAQQSFIQQFGPPVITNTVKELTSRNHRPHLLDIATVDEDGKPLVQGSFVHIYMLANQLWHTDGSQAQPPTRLTALSARTLPPRAPNTEYADMRAAWDDLSAEMKRAIDDLQVEHSIVYSRSLLGMGDGGFSADTLKRRPPVQHPLVRTHAKTGRKSLYLSAHASHIIGWPVDKGRALLKELTAHATQRKYVYAHEWSRGDLVMWDNSASMHRALPYNDPEPRILRWSAVQELAPV